MLSWIRPLDKELPLPRPLTECTVSRLGKQDKSQKTVKTCQYRAQKISFPNLETYVD
ncbi:hypothetical protein LEMLEM_LOCUS1686 [Lemmus lemmus]